MIVLRSFPIIDLAGNTIDTIEIPCESDPELPREELMTEDGHAAVRAARIERLKNTFWLAEYEARMSVVEVAAAEGFPLGMGFYAPGQDAIWPLDHAKWIRRVYPA